MQSIRFYFIISTHIIDFTNTILIFVADKKQRIEENILFFICRCNKIHYLCNVSATKRNEIHKVARWDFLCRIVK